MRNINTAEQWEALTHRGHIPHPWGMPDTLLLWVCRTLLTPGYTDINNAGYGTPTSTTPDMVHRLQYWARLSYPGSTGLGSLTPGRCNTGCTTRAGVTRAVLHGHVTRAVLYMCGVYVLPPVLLPVLTARVDSPSTGHYLRN